ncbi:helix-turn-helix domain protein [Parafrankia sp. EAN1pec]|uniref:helix-turn-helix domain-containing protein n=1 Tax=Parafrankia sp. (strain EAN1pec) TaxID=298653 RepID=UPI00005419BA|nr:helix-turn-helix domain protein [Frankia sp. EAN1pec]
MVDQRNRGPVALRILLGGQLRRFREEREITREAAGYAIRSSDSKISRLELGRVAFKIRDIEDLLTLYGVDDEAVRAPLLALAREANQPGWWRAFAAVLPDWSELYLGLETAATQIRAYEAQFIPDLLQTEDYARAAIGLNSSQFAAPPGELERRISLRIRRQEILTHPEDPATLWVVLDEAALRRPVGGPRVTRAQMKHLLAVSEQPNVIIQVMPFAFGGHAAEGGTFSILRFAEPELSDVVHCRYLTGAVYLDKPADVLRYSEVMGRMIVDSTQPGEFADYLQRILAEE